MTPVTSTHAVPFDQIGLPSVVSNHWAPFPNDAAPGRAVVIPEPVLIEQFIWLGRSFG